MDIEEIGKEIVDASLHGHKAGGPGLLESAHQACLAYELRQRGLHGECEVDQPVHSGTIEILPGYRLDMIVENTVIVENTSVESLSPIHETRVASSSGIAG
jgi:GxxExxY protein